MPYTETHLKESRWAGVREVMTMSWPIVLGSLSYTVLEFCDKWMVAHLGTAPLAAIGSSALWSYTFSTLLLGIVGCVSTFAAQCYGKNDKQECARYAWQGIYLAFFAALFALPMWPLAKPLFATMGHSDEVTAMEVVYFKIRLLGYIPMAWGTALAAFFQAVNRPRIPMYVAILTTALNLVLNYLLIFGKFGFPALGIRGAAIATVISQYAHALIMQAIMIGPSLNREFNTRANWRPNERRIRELFRIGLPNGGAMLLDIVVWAIFTSYIVGHFGDVAMAAHNIALSFMHICFMPAVAMNQGVAAIVGQWLGRKNVAMAKKRTYTALKICMAYMVIMGLIFAFFGHYLIMKTFSDVPEVVELGYKLLLLAAFFQAFDAINIICMGALRGAGDTRWIMWVMFCNAYLLFLPISIVAAFVFNVGAYGAWVTGTFFIVGVSLLVLRRFDSEKWRHINIFLDDIPVEDAGE